MGVRPGSSLSPPGPTPSAAQVVRLLDGASIAFHSLALHEPTLDDVFLALTGHAAQHPEGAAT